MPSRTNTKTKRKILRATGEKEPKGPVRSLRLPADLDHLVEGRIEPTSDRAAVLLDLIRKGLRYERLRQAKGDPVLGELIDTLDGMLTPRLSAAVFEIYKHVFIESHTLRKLLKEVITDARISSRAAEKLLAGDLFTPTSGGANPALEEFVADCEVEAESIFGEYKDEREHEMDLAFGATTAEAPPATNHPDPPEEAG